MIHAARKLIEATFTTTAVNAEIALLNTALDETAADIALVADGRVLSADQAGTYPCLLHYVGVTEPAMTEVPRTAKRDFPELPVSLAVHSRVGSLASAVRDVEIALEALLPVLDSLRGQAYKTYWGIADVQTLSLQVTPFVHEGAVVRIDGLARCTLFLRRTGV